MKILKKIWWWIDDRSGLSEIFGPILKHPVPPGSKWSYVFGSATLVCLLLQVATGIALSLHYQPSSANAYQSLQYITMVSAAGRWLRALHYYGASGMLIMIGIHMLRVYITAAYKYPREMSWISGVILFLLVIIMGFTGQLLRWDSDGVWSSVVAAEQIGRVPLIGPYISRLLIGGDTIGGESLSRFYAFHVFIVPACIFLLVGFHLMLVIRNGISEPAEAGRPVDPKSYRQWYKDMLQKKGLPFWPYAAWRDIVFAAFTVTAIFSLAFIFGPPALTQPPDPSIIHTQPQPEWYLKPVFALYALMPKQIESFFMFTGPIIIGVVLLALPFVSNRGERSPLRRPWAVFGALCVIVFTMTLLWIGIKSPWALKFKTKPLETADIPIHDTISMAGAKLMYAKGCLYCHMYHNKGGLNGPDLTEVQRRLTNDEMRIKIVNGSIKMPAYGSILNNGELAAIVAFLGREKKD